MECTDAPSRVAVFIYSSLNRDFDVRMRGCEDVRMGMHGSPWGYWLFCRDGMRPVSDTSFCSKNLHIIRCYCVAFGGSSAGVGLFGRALPAISLYNTLRISHQINYWAGAQRNTFDLGGA